MARRRPGVPSAVPSNDLPSKLATHYRDFVISARRKDPRTIEVCVEQSAAGASRRVAVPFGDAEATAIRNSFRGIVDDGQIAYGSSPKGPAKAAGYPHGRMLITQEEATEIGKRLARVLFPSEVFRLLAESIAQCVKQEGAAYESAWPATLH